MTQLPGLTPDGYWDVPARLNMAAQCLDHASDQVAIIDTDRGPVTYGELRVMAEGLARRLAGRITTEDRVGVLLGQDPWCLASHLAIWWLGAKSVPLFKLFQHDALASRIGDAGVKLVLTDAAGAALLGDLADPLIASEAGQAGPAVPMAETGPETPAILIYTSGTTGKPKGAVHGHRLLTGHLPGVVLSHDALGQPGDCLWTPADWAWIGGLFDVALPGLALGVPVVASRAARFDPESVADLIATHGIRNVFFPPTALRMLKAAGRAIPDLRSVASGGEPLGAEMLDWGRRSFGLQINEFYGQTECNMVVSTHAGAARPGCAGRPVPGFEVAVIDAEGRATDAEGDIAVRRGAASMMQGYWRNPTASAAKFRGDWMLTGDRGVMEDGFLRFVGREDDVITSSGYRIGPGEIEDCLLTHPDVATCGVVGKPDPFRTEIVKAYVVPRTGRAPEPRALQDWVRTRLAAHAYPREITFLDALPMTVTGKVIRKELRARAAAEGAP